MKYVLVLLILYGREPVAVKIQQPSRAACKAAQVEADKQAKVTAATISFCLPGEA